MTGDKANAAKPDERKKAYRPYPKKADDGTRPKEGIPMLKYRKGNYIEVELEMNGGDAADDRMLLMKHRLTQMLPTISSMI
jgi:hypothetical protein